MSYANQEHIKQVELEQGMKQEGARKALEQMQKTIQGGDFSDTSAGRKMLVESMQVVLNKSLDIICAVERGKSKVHGNIAKIIRPYMEGIEVYDYEEALSPVFLTAISTIVDSLANKNISKQKMIAMTGQAIRDELKIQYASRQTPKGADKTYAEVLAYKLDEAKKTNTKWKQLKKRIIRDINKRDLTAPLMSDSEAQMIGGMVVEFMIDFCELIEGQVVYNGAQNETLLSFSDKANSILGDVLENVHKTACYHKPMTVAPEAWTDFKTGGYLTLKRPLVRNCKFKDIESIDFSYLMDVANTLQDVPFTIDMEQAKFLRECLNAGVLKNSKGKCIMYTATPLEKPHRPAILNGLDEDKKSWSKEEKAALKEYKDEMNAWYSEDKKRQSKVVSTHRVLEIAEQYGEYDQIYFPVNFDNRYRTYYMTAMLNPQGDNFTKSLLKFKKKYLIDEEAAYHFAQYLCGVWDVKGTLQERIDWVLENEGMLAEVAEDPWANRQWLDADEPFVAVKVAREWTRLRDAQDRDEPYYSNISCFSDGSCNGLQHQAAMTMDEVVGHKVNLVQTSDQPEDVYTHVGSTTLESLAKSRDPLLNKWFNFGIPRGVAKKPVMTFVYGSKPVAFMGTKLGGYAGAIYDEINGTNTPFQGNEYKASTKIAHKFEKEMKKSMQRPVEVREYLQKAATVYAKYAVENQTEEHKSPGLTWFNANGCLVMQDYRDVIKQKYKARIGYKQIQLYLEEEQQNISVNSMKLGISANFTHSMDASHMHRVILEAKAQGIDSMWMIHDSFGCSPAHMGKMQKIIRRTFIDMYTEQDVLEQFDTHLRSLLPEEWHEVLPELPSKGTLELEKLMDSEFAFL